MTNISCFTKKIIFFLLSFFFYTSGTWAVDQMAFADALMAEGDYFRAITVLKELKFYSTDENEKWKAERRILRAYWSSQKFETALGEVLRSQILTGPDPEKRFYGYLYAGMNFYGLDDLKKARKYMETALNEFQDRSFYPELYLGLMDARIMKWETAQGHWNRALAQTDDEGIKKTISEAVDFLKEIPQQPEKSPVLAGILSTIVPGAGQGYTGHWVDAFQSFFTVGLMGAAAYGAYLYDSSQGNTYVYTGIGVSLTGLLHLANILGAWNTAGYSNTKQTQLNNQKLESLILTLPLP